MTGFKDADIDQSEWEAYRDAAADSQLSANVCVLFHTPVTADGAQITLDRIRTAQRELSRMHRASLGVCGAKLYIDGSTLGHTAWMYEDFDDGAAGNFNGSRGFPAMPPALYRSQVEQFVRAGVSVGTHAIGDQAIDWVVDTYDEAIRSTSAKNLRLSVIHANTPSDHAIKIMATLQREFDSGIPETQAEFLWWIGAGFPRVLGALRSQRLIPLRTYLDRGMIWAGGSDAPVTPFAARFGLWSSVARQTLQGDTPFGTGQTVDIHAALRSYTIWAARQLFMEKHTGSLELGKKADIAVWDRDLYLSPTDQLKDLVCELTLFHGKVVFDKTTLH